MKSNKGITLIALVITIIVLLILAGAAVSIALNSENIFEKANTAVESNNRKLEEEETNLRSLIEYIDKDSIYYENQKIADDYKIYVIYEGSDITGVTRTTFNSIGINNSIAKIQLSDRLEINVPVSIETDWYTGDSKVVIGTCTAKIDGNDVDISSLHVIGTESNFNLANYYKMIFENCDTEPLRNYMN